MSSERNEHTILPFLLSLLGSDRIDNSEKKVGDRVRLVDIYHLNYFIDAISDMQLTNDLQIVSDELRDLFLSQKMIVIEIGVDKMYRCGHCERDHHHDMVIFLPEMNRKWHCSSDRFAIIE